MSNGLLLFETRVSHEGLCKLKKLNVLEKGWCGNRNLRANYWMNYWKRVDSIEDSAELDNNNYDTRDQLLELYLIQKYT